MFSSSVASTSAGDDSRSFRTRVCRAGLGAALATVFFIVRCRVFDDGIESSVPN